MHAKEELEVSLLIDIYLTACKFGNVCFDLGANAL
jgi:hypothetical protein